MSRRSSLPAAIAATLLFAFALNAVQQWLEQGALSDVGGYEDVANFIRAGHLPYSDQVSHPLAYPPAALVAYSSTRGRRVAPDWACLGRLGMAASREGAESFASPYRPGPAPS